MRPYRIHTRDYPRHEHYRTMFDTTAASSQKGCTDEERALVALFRQLTPQGREAVLMLVSNQANPLGSSKGASNVVSLFGTQPGP